LADGYQLVCECLSGDCAQSIQVQASVDEQLRRHEARFVVAPGHERPGHDRVVAEGGRYIVVATSLPVVAEAAEQKARAAA
jgi:hypothetical protein